MKLTPRLKKAIDTAAFAHGAQTRKDQRKTPYISHPYGLVILLSEFTDDEDVLIAALLHDVIEDVDPKHYSPAQIEADFGKRVLDIVQGVTEDKGIENYSERKEDYNKGLLTDSEESLLVSAADLTHNIRSMVEDITNEGAEALQRWQYNPQDRLWAWEERTRILEERLKSPIVHQLRQALEELKKLYPVN